MSISVSYTGGDGRQRSFEADGLPTAGSELDRLIRGTPIAPAQTGRLALRRQIQPQPASGKVRSSETDELGYLEEKLLPSGSIAMSNGKMCLKGETDGMQFVTPKFYTSKRGVPKYRTIAEMDSVESPRDIGGPALSTSEEPDQTAKDMTEEYAVRLSIQTRTVLKITKDPSGSPDMITIYSFSRELRFSAIGRLLGVGPERRVVVGSFKAAGEGNGKYGVRPVWVSLAGDEEAKRLSSLLFGDNDSLSGDIEDVRARDSVAEVDVFTHGELG